MNMSDILMWCTNRENIFLNSMIDRSKISTYDNPSYNFESQKW